MIRLLLMLSLAMTSDSRGASIGPAVISVSALCTLLGALMVIFRRRLQDRPIVPLQVFKMPIVIVILAYFLVGLMSGINALEQGKYVKEVVQRVLMLFLCPYFFAMGPRTLKDLDWSMLMFLPVGGFLALVSSVLGASTGFAEPVYMTNIHKNAVGDSNAALLLVCAAFLMTKCHPRLWLVFWLFGAVGTIGIVAAQARSSFLGTVIGLIAMFGASKIGLKWIIGLLVAQALVLVIIVNVLPSKVLEYMTTAKRHSSNMVRIYSYTEIIEHIKSDPLNCVGWGNSPRSLQRTEIDPTTNVLLHDWLQLGPIGALLTLVLLILSVKLPLDNARHISIRDDPTLAAINLAALGVITLHVVHGMFDTFWVGRGPQLSTFQFLGIAIFVRLWLAQKGSARPSIFLQKASAQ